MSEQVEQKNCIYSYHLTLFSAADEMFELWLPKIPDGFFRFPGELSSILSISAKNNHWFAMCENPAYFSGNNISPLGNYEVPLKDGDLLQINVDDFMFFLLVEKLLPQRNIFTTYDIQPDIEISIGSQSDCDIYYRGPFLSRRHAVISRFNGQWRIRCLDSRYGLFVNKKRTDMSTLTLGDVIYLMGLKIIVGQNFLSMNNGFGETLVSNRILQNTALSGSYKHYHNYSPASSNNNEQYFNRAPRKKKETQEQTITIEGPPMSMSQKQMPLLLRMGSSMVMGGAAAIAGNFMTLISSVMFPFLSSKYTENQRQEYEKLRLTKYTEYLDKKKQEISNAIKLEQDELNSKYPELSQVINSIKSNRFWERRPNDSDFLQLRLGTGNRPLSATIEYPTRRFELESDSLEDQMYELAEAAYAVENAPIILSLIDTFICSIQGSGSQLLSLIRSLIAQITVFHSYDEVKILFLINQQDLTELDNIRYLPHVWDDIRKTRFIATTESEAYALGEYVKSQIADMDFDKESVNLHKALKTRPYHVIFAMDKNLFGAHEVFKDILKFDCNVGFSIITSYDEMPKESQKIIALDNYRHNTCTTMNVDGGDDEIFEQEEFQPGQFNEAIHKISNINLKQIEQAHALPKMVTFLDMFKVGRVEHLNPLKRWRENNPTKSLAAPVGLAEDGSVFMLDLHEKHQGPHGLVAGMTGSGKSEFIISYILSMAVNYHPDEVAFVLIDYKGGGLADAFENPRTGVRLPHLAGTITNLDGASIQRSLMSIESELVRRQKEFSEASKNFDEGSMNIYTYQKLYRAGKVSNPMPHLFIISDEFAELKQQQPDFMEKLISAARIGRSLGVHLILATQKPSGVVNDQIRSNTKFRVCLRVQDRADSMDMLKRPEAAELTDTGRFYLQVGYNEYFALGQSAWCGADYEPQDTLPVHRDDSIEFLDITGQVVALSKPIQKKSSSGVKQISAVVQYLSSLAKSQNISVRQLCIPPLKAILDINDVYQHLPETNLDSVEVAIGIVDDPKNQAQFPLIVKLQEYQNLLILGNSGSGKTTLLKTLLYSLVTNYTPDSVNYYILDFSGGTLKSFENAPHCGTFLTEHDEPSIDRFMQFLRDLIKERKHLFSQLGVTSYNAYKAIKNLPLILVIIDNAAGMTSLKNGNTYFSTLHEYLKDAPALGIKIIITASNLNEVNTRARQEIGDRIALQLKDKYAYADLFGGKSAHMPLAINGRGMCLYDERKLEFQTAMPFSTHTDIERGQLIGEFVEAIAERDKNCSAAKKLPVIDPTETYFDFCKNIPSGRIPLGYDLNNIKPVSIPFKQLFSSAIYFSEERMAVPIISNVLFACEKNGMDLIFVKRNSESIFDSGAINLSANTNLTLFESTKQSSAELCQLLIDEIKKRKVYRNEFCTMNNIPLEQAKLPHNVKKSFNYIKENTTPLSIVFEDFLDFSENSHDSTFSIYQDIFANGKGYNFYFFGCFYPIGSANLARNLLAKTYVDTALLLLFGNKIDSQTLVALPAEYRKVNALKLKNNEFLMRYNDFFYPMMMPSQPLLDKEIDPDDKPII